MDSFFSYGVFAFDVNDNSYLIEGGETEALMLNDDERAKVNDERQAAGKPPIVTIEDILDKDYLIENGVGIKPYICILDQGGHRADEVKYFVRTHKMTLMQKGTAMTTSNWKKSDNQPKLILANEKYFRSLLVYQLYSQKDKRQNYFFISPDLSEDFVKQIIGTKPDASSKWGHLPENWIDPTQNDHAFDCCKYFLLLKDFCLHSLYRSRYRFGQAPSILRQFAKQIAAENAAKDADATNIDKYSDKDS